MDAQELRNLQEAYMEVYEAVDDEGRAYGKPTRPIVRTELPDHMKSPKPRPVMTYAERTKKEASKTPEQKEAGRQKRMNLAKTLLRQPQEEQVDLYDIILSHLLDEGYAETLESAEAIMVNMSEEWREGILDEAADNVIMTVKSPSGQERSKIRKGAWGPSDSHRHEKPEQIANRRFSQQLADRKREREERMRAGRLTVATKRGIEAATNISNDGVGGNRFVQGSSLRARERDDVPTDYRARRRRASGR